MEHNSGMSFNNGLEITFSDPKYTESGEKYVTIYFEEPNEDKTDFKSAQIDYPIGDFENVNGYSDLTRLQYHLGKIGPVVLEMEGEEDFAEAF